MTGFDDRRIRVSDILAPIVMRVAAATANTVPFNGFCATHANTETDTSGRARAVPSCRRVGLQPAVRAMMAQAGKDLGGGRHRFSKLLGVQAAVCTPGPATALIEIKAITASEVSLYAAVLGMPDVPRWMGKPSMRFAASANRQNQKDTAHIRSSAANGVLFSEATTNATGSRRAEATNALPCRPWLWICAPNSSTSLSRCPLCVRGLGCANRSRPRDSAIVASASGAGSCLMATWRIHCGHWHNWATGQIDPKRTSTGPD